MLSEPAKISRPTPEHRCSLPRALPLRQHRPGSVSPSFRGMEGEHTGDVWVPSNTPGTFGSPQTCGGLLGPLRCSGDSWIPLNTSRTFGFPQTCGGLLDPLEHSGDFWVPSPAEHPAHMGVSDGAKEPQTPRHALGDGNRGRKGTPAREAAGPTCARAGGQAGRTKLPFHLRGAIRAVTRDVPSRDVPAYQRLPPGPAPRGGSGGGDGVVVFAQPCLPWLFFFFFPSRFLPKGLR